MSGQTTLAFWQLLLLTLGPATLAAGVAILAPIILEGRKQRAEAHRRRADKLEELIRALYEYDHWIDQMRNERVLGAKVDPGITPLSKIHAIIDIYFPPLHQKLAPLTAAAFQYEKWAVAAAQKRLKNAPDLLDGFEEFAGPYHNAFAAFLKEVVAVAGSIKVTRI